MEALSQFIVAGGFMMYPLLLLSLIATAIIIERAIVFTYIGTIPKNLLTSTIALCKKSQFDEALGACRKKRGPVAAALATVLEHRKRAVPTIERYVQEIGEEYFLRLERYLSVLDTTTTISPLLGLLGTILGMIRAFDAISNAQQTGGNTDAVLHGVAEALYATATGISIAVVCFIAYNYFATRVRDVNSETEMCATKLLNVLSELGEVQ